MDQDLVINPSWSDRRQNRCAAFRFLFQWEMNPSDDLNRDLDEFLSKLEKEDDFFSYAVELIAGVIEKKDILDSIIRELVTNWDFSRVAKADLALLRLSLYEIKYRLDVPPVVAIDEALEIGKEFSSENSGKFLNGVLDKARKQIARPARESFSLSWSKKFTLSCLNLFQFLLLRIRWSVFFPSQAGCVRQKESPV